MPISKVDILAHICGLSDSTVRWEEETEEFLKFQGPVIFPYAVAHIKRKVRNDL